MKALASLLLIIANTIAFSQNNVTKSDSLSPEEIAALHEFDLKLSEQIDNYSYGDVYFKFRDLKKIARENRKKAGNEDLKLNDYIDSLALETLFKEDPILSDLGISEIAMANLERTLEENDFFDSKTTIAQKRRMFKTLSSNKLYFSKDIFKGFADLGFYDAGVDMKTFKSKVEYLIEYNTVQYLYESMKSWIELNELNKNYKNYDILDQKMTILTDHLNDLTKERYYKYGFTDISSEKIKDISISSDNDVFMDFTLSDYNRDMGLTGGLRLEVGTDFMKMRLLPYINGDDIVSYQTFHCGFRVFTPYLRDTIDALKLVSYNHDRPFASTEYFGRTKYRLHRKGAVKHTGNFDFIIIGGQIAPYFQKLLHKDITVASIYPVGWESQISNGGRLGINLNHKFDFMLASKDASIFRGCANSRWQFLNPFLSLEGQLSHEKTFAGVALSFSSRDFFNSSGNYQDFKLKKLQKFRFDYLLTFNYQYVFHNSLLEDFGIFEPFDDDKFDSEFLSSYFLDGNQINRSVFSTSFQGNYRYRFMTFFYRFVLHTKEFNESSLDDVINVEYKTILEDRFDYNWYGYATLGMVLNLKQ